MPIKREGDLASSIIEYIKKNIVPVLPEVSETYVTSLGGKASNAKTLSASFLCRCMRALYLEIDHKENLNSAEVFALRAFLAETLRVGNCIEFALVAAIKLINCPDVSKVMRIGDKSANDHAYLKIIDKVRVSWIYDPWLERDRLFTEADHLLRMKELGLLKVEPELVVDAILPLSYGRDYSEALDSSSDEDFGPISPESLFRRYRETFLGIVETESKFFKSPADAFVIRCHERSAVSGRELHQAKKLTDDMLSRFRL